MKDCVLIDTTPKDVRSRGSVNLGYEIVRQKLNADIAFWHENIKDYSHYYFNIFYPMNLINALSCIHKNKIGAELYSLGGQGVSNLSRELGLDIYRGELDGDKLDGKGWNRATAIVSPSQVKGDCAVIELTRGCKYRCKFCEYGNVTGGEYREKSIELVKQQIDETFIRNINFMSANFAGYSRLDELMQYCQWKNKRVMNTDVCLMDIKRVYPWLEPFSMRTVKIGVESFNESTRTMVGKGFSDMQLEAIIESLLKHCNNLHFYLIYGLPGDDYSTWYRWVEKLGQIRKRYTFRQPHLFDGIVTQNTTDIRIEFSITNFEPCIGTPLENATLVNFKEKDEFLTGWFEVLQREGFLRSKGIPTYATAHGRIGRKERSYRLLMDIKQGHSPMLLEELTEGFPNGISRSVEDKEIEKYLTVVAQDEG